MSPEQRNFLHTVPLTAQQRVYVEACWEQQPDKNRPLGLLGRAFDYFVLYCFVLFLLVCLVVWRHPAAVLGSLITTWFCVVIGTFGLGLIISTITEKLKQVRNHWGEFTPGDSFMTQRWFLKRLITPRPVWRAPVLMLLSGVGMMALVMSRHWITAVAYALSMVVSMVFNYAVAPAVTQYIAKRTHAYAEHVGLEPEIDPTMMNPNHPRRVVG